MPKIILYIATSLVGFIADKNSKVDWLNEFPFTKEMEEDYNKFYENISTVVMGGKTYRQVINELSPKKWVYEGKESFVFTKSKLENTTKLKLIDCKNMGNNIVKLVYKK